jgi:hypothetical protein
MFVRLPGKFVSGFVISLAVSCGSRLVGVRRKVMELCGPVVRTLWHGVLLSGWMLTSESASAPLASAIFLSLFERHFAIHSRYVIWKIRRTI